MTRRLRIVAALAAALVLLVASPAAAHTTPLPGETLPALVKRTCGTSAGWQDQAARNGIATTGPRAYWVYLGRSYDIRCGPSAPAAPAPSGVWVNPLPGTCRPATGGVFGIPHDHNRDGIVDHYHMGIDLGSREGYGVGARVVAARAGTVSAVGWSGGAGLRVIINHGGGWTSHYHHLSSEIVSTGQQVAAGQRIGSMGATGNATGPHLHVETRLNGVAKDPRLILPVRC